MPPPSSSTRVGYVPISEVINLLSQERKDAMPPAPPAPAKIVCPEPVGKTYTVTELWPYEWDGRWYEKKQYTDESTDEAQKLEYAQEKQGDYQKTIKNIAKMFIREIHDRVDHEDIDEKLTNTSLGAIGLNVNDACVVPPPMKMKMAGRSHKHYLGLGTDFASLLNRVFLKEEHKSASRSGSKRIINLSDKISAEPRKISKEPEPLLNPKFLAQSMASETRTSGVKKDTQQDEGDKSNGNKDEKISSFTGKMKDRWNVSAPPIFQPREHTGPFSGFVNQSFGKDLSASSPGHFNSFAGAEHGGDNEFMSEIQKNYQAFLEKKECRWGAPSYDASRQWQCEDMLGSRPWEMDHNHLFEQQQQMDPMALWEWQQAYMHGGEGPSWNENYHGTPLPVTRFEEEQTDDDDDEPYSPNWFRKSTAEEGDNPFFPRPSSPGKYPETAARAAAADGKRNALNTSAPAAMTTEASAPAVTETAATNFGNLALSCPPGLDPLPHVLPIFNLPDEVPHEALCGDSFGVPLHLIPRHELERMAATMRFSREWEIQQAKAAMFAQHVARFASKGQNYGPLPQGKGFLPTQGWAQPPANIQGKGGKSTSKGKWGKGKESGSLHEGHKMNGAPKGKDNGWCGYGKKGKRSKSQGKGLSKGEFGLEMESGGYYYDY